jgi:hypothetical protein
LLGTEKPASQMEPEATGDDDGTDDDTSEDERGR